MTNTCHSRWTQCYCQKGPWARDERHPHIFSTRYGKNRLPSIDQSALKAPWRISFLYWMCVFRQWSSKSSFWKCISSSAKLCNFDPLCRCQEARQHKHSKRSYECHVSSREVNASATLNSSEVSTLPGISEQAIHLAFPNGAVRELERPLPGFDDIEQAVRDFQAGEFLVVLDNEDRENEGDLIIAAEMVSYRANLGFGISLVEDST